MLPGRKWITTGAVLAGLAITAGALGAHGLAGWFVEVDEAENFRLTSIAGSSKAVEAKSDVGGTYEVAVRYQMYHALALLAVGLLATRMPTSRALAVAGQSFLVGTLIFSGMLYALVFSYALVPGGVKILGAIVPIGGVGMIVGWIALALAGYSANSERAT